MPLLLVLKNYILTIKNRTVELLTVRQQLIKDQD